MAILKIYAVHDDKVGVYGRPFCESSDVLAVRGLNVAVNDKTIQLSHFPEDFSLYHLGSFDEESGAIGALGNPVFVVSAVSQKRLSEEVDRVSRNSDPVQSAASGVDNRVRRE